MGRTMHIRDRDVITSIVSSFKGENFTTEHVKNAMAAFPPVRRIPAIQATRLIKIWGLAEPIGMVCVPVGATHRMTMMWRSL